MSKKKNSEVNSDSSSKTSEASVKSSAISEIARKVFLTGVGAIFMTEESVRNALADLKLPKEAISYVVDQAKKQKNDLVSAVTQEFSKFLSKIKVQEEIRKALSSFEIHVDATLRFSPRSKPDHSFMTLKVKSDDSSH